MRPSILCVGGMDSSGGAGLLRDAATVAAMGGHMRAAVTAVTAQTDRAVCAVHPVPVDVLRAQIASAGAVGAVKIGMLGTAQIVGALRSCLPDVPCLLDPVLLSSSGHPLLEERGLDALLGDLLPRMDLVTPNLPELFALARHIGCGSQDPAAAARALLGGGVRAVLVKGGHGDGAQSVDMLYRDKGTPRPFAAPRVAATLRGTGCRLASAIACKLALGASLETAIAAGKAHVHAALLGAEDRAAG